MMTNQEIFDKVLTHLRTQGVASVDDNGNCRYRGPNGTSCAVGCLIPDELYDPEMEGYGIVNLPYSSEAKVRQRNVQLLKDALFGAGLKWEQNPLLAELQRVHDAGMTSGADDEWELRMREVANKFGLIYRRKAA